MDDREAVAATVRDYWEGWFDGDAVRMERAVHPGLTKTGVVTEVPSPRISGPMTADDMIKWTRAGEGVAEKSADAAYEVTIDDIYHEIATATVRSGIYREYLHLAKTSGGWKILNAIYMRVREEPTVP